MAQMRVVEDSVHESCSHSSIPTDRVMLESSSESGTVIVNGGNSHFLQNWKNYTPMPPKTVLAPFQVKLLMLIIGVILIVMITALLLGTMAILCYGSKNGRFCIGDAPSDQDLESLQEQVQNLSTTLEVKYNTFAVFNSLFQNCTNETRMCGINYNSVSNVTICRTRRVRTVRRVSH